MKSIIFSYVSPDLFDSDMKSIIFSYVSPDLFESNMKSIIFSYVKRSIKLALLIWATNRSHN